METVYFILGVLSVLVLLGVVGIVKIVFYANEMKESKRILLDRLEESETGIYQQMENEVDDLKENIDDVRKVIDSRNDKMLSSIEKTNDEIFRRLNILEK